MFIADAAILCAGRSKVRSYSSRIHLHILYSSAIPRIQGNRRICFSAASENTDVPTYVVCICFNQRHIWQSIYQQCAWLKDRLESKLRERSSDFAPFESEMDGWIPNAFSSTWSDFGGLVCLGAQRGSWGGNVPVCVANSLSRWAHKRLRAPHSIK